MMMSYLELLPPGLEVCYLLLDVISSKVSLGDHSLSIGTDSCDVCLVTGDLSLRRITYILIFIFISC